MPTPKAFIALEQSLAATMHAVWEKKARKILAQLDELIGQRRWSDAHLLADRLSMQGVVDDVRPRLEELGVSALLFGAHHVTGSLKTTSFVNGSQELPTAMQGAFDQLVEMLQNDAADFVRRQLHAMISDLRQRDETAHVQKDDLDTEDLEENGGLQEADQSAYASVVHRRRKRKDEIPDALTLYVKRTLLNADDLIGWARSQGFDFAQLPEDMHVTIAYSKTPFDWRDMKPLQPGVKTVNDVRDVQQFGDATVLTFTSPELEDRWQEFRDHGASWSHDGFRPHVTISWHFEGDLSKVEPYRGPLIFGPEIFDTINEDWKAEHVELVLRKAELSLADRLNDAVLNGGKLQIDIGANLTTSRLVSLGFLSEAKKAGVTEYQVNEVLDAKTCPVCRYMQGKRFKVQAEHDRLIQVLSTSDPQELKSLAPWPSRKKADLQEMYALSESEMQARGWGSPPYHPGCRGLLNLNGAVEEDVPLGGGDQAVELPTTGLKIPDFKAIGVVETVPAASSTVSPGKWTPEAISQVGWDRFQITDPHTFILADEAFSAGDFDLVQQILGDWIALTH